MDTSSEDVPKTVSEIGSVRLTEPLDVLHEYFHRVDGRDTEGAVQLFAADAQARFMLGRYFEGREQIFSALQRIVTDFARTSHHVTNVRVVVRERQRAELRSYVYAYHRLAVTGKPWHLWGRLRDVFIGNGDSWLISEHILDGVDAAPDRRRIAQEGYAGHPGREWDPLPDPGDPARDALATVHVGAAEAIEALRSASETTGPVEPHDAALIAACAAAALRFDVGCRQALERARRAGLPAEEAWAAAALLLVSRGQAVAYPFADALLALYGRPRQRSAIGERTGAAAAPAFLTDHASDAATDGYGRLLTAVRVQAALPLPVRELILCGVNAAERQPDAFRRHVQSARQAGATDAEIAHAVLAVVPVAGTIAYAFAETVLKPT